MNRIYLDNNATTALDPRVFRAMYPHHLEPANPSSVHFFGQKAKKLLQEARRKIADTLGVKAPEIIFTSGATEGINLCMRGLVRTSDHLITSDIEHSCIYETALQLEQQGAQVTFLKADPSGQIDPDSLRRTITPKTKAIVLTAVNGETGVKCDIEAFSDIAKEHEIPLIIDGVALLGKETFSIPEAVTAMCFSGHKIHGPKGTGFIALRPRTKLTPLITGGDQEYQKRAGTENLEGILGLAEAVWLLQSELPAKAHMMKDLRDHFEMTLRKEFDVRINGKGNRISNVSNLAFLGIDGETLLMALDQVGIAVSHGSACASGALEPSRVLRNMGIDNKQARSSLRFSFSRFSTKEEVEKTLAELRILLPKLRSN